MTGSRLAIVTGTHRFPEPLLALARPLTLRGPGGTVEAHEYGDLVLVNRHGPGERTPVHRVDHAANVEAIASVCDRVLAVGSCGGLRTSLGPGTMVAVADVFAPWVTPTLFDDDRAESMPGLDLGWRAEVVAAWRGAAKVQLVDGGTYVQSRGPRFETPAEVRFYATVGDVVGMTLAAEMVLAREAGLRHAAVCVVDNLANGIGERRLTVSEFEATARANRERLWAAVFATVAQLGVAVG